jgi:hypothetical protein
LTGTSEVEAFHSLAVRDLERGHSVGLPSGEAVARHLGDTPLTAAEIGAAQAGWHGETPLWYFSCARLAFVAAAIYSALLAR